MKQNSIKKSAIALAAAFLLSTQAAQAESACETIMCMAGLLQGAGEVENCGGPISKYFSIEETDDGDFDPEDTAKARADFLAECPENDNGWSDKINDKYGGVER